MRIATLLAATAALAGCAANNVTQSRGPDSYLVTTTGGLTTAMGAATRSAEKTCATSGKHSVITERSNWPKDADIIVELAFRCE